MDNQPTQPARKTQDIIKAELERKSRDLYKVFNPTNQDFQVILNARISPEVWTIEAQSEAIVPQYVAVKYFEEMSSKIILAKSDKLVLEENDKWLEKTGRKMDLHSEQARFESRNLKNLMSRRDQVVQVLNRGLYKEYGVGENTVEVMSNKYDKRSFDPGIDLGTDGVRAVNNTIKEESPVETPVKSEIIDNTIDFDPDNTITVIEDEEEGPITIKKDKKK